MSNTEKLICKNKPLMIAHRGLSGLEKENTHAAFVAAGNRSYYGIETDVHRTIDGKYVCIHDANTQRVGIDAINVEDCTYDTVCRLKLCGISGKKDRSDICIPSLEEYIRICKHYEKTAVLELKGIYTKEQISEICNIIIKEDWFQKTIFIAFDLDNLIQLKELYPDQNAQYLVGESYFKKSGTNQDLLDILNKYDLDLDIYYKSLTEELAEKVHANGRKINVWTVNTQEDATRLNDIYGIDFITTNILE